MAVRSLRQTLTAYRAGGFDPTTRLTNHSFLHATHTPDGPATLRLRWAHDPAPIAECGLIADAWGPGRAWLLATVDSMTGRDDQPSEAMVRFEHAPAVVTRALRETRTADTAWRMLASVGA